MIVEVTNRNRTESIDEFFHQIDLDIQSALHEFEYNCIVDQYNYLAEYGMIMEASDEKNSIGKWLKNLADTFIRKIKEIGRWIKNKYNALISKIKDPKKKKQVQDAINKTDKEESEAIRDINDAAKEGTKESGNSMSKIFSIFESKQKKKLKEVEGAVEYRKSKKFGDERWYDKNGKLIHHKNSNGYGYWKDYAKTKKNGEIIHYTYSDGKEEWYEYDENDKLIHYKDSNGDEYWQEYDKNGKLIHHKNSNGHEKWY